ncbi:MAG: hypothetical protein J6B51_01680, partial [Clostridia bacterium]|nr:hypothetical protein [Clostridia bacterium]
NCKGSKNETQGLLNASKTSGCRWKRGILRLFELQNTANFAFRQAKKYFKLLFSDTTAPPM